MFYPAVGRDKLGYSSQMPCSLFSLGKWVVLAGGVSGELLVWAGFGVEGPFLWLFVERCTCCPGEDPLDKGTC